MATITISLPDSMKAFVAEQVRAGGYSTTSEYVRSLLREAQQVGLGEATSSRSHQGPILTKKELDAMLLEGIEALERGEGYELNEEGWNELRERLLKRSRARTGTQTSE